jgi:hypothetical protein
MTTICRSKTNLGCNDNDLHPIFSEIDKAFVSDAIHYYSICFPKKTIFEITEMVIIDFRIDKENIILLLNLVPKTVANALLKVEMIEVKHLEYCLNKGLKPFVISNRIKQLFEVCPYKFAAFPKTIKLLK